MKNKLGSIIEGIVSTVVVLAVIGALIVSYIAASYETPYGTEINWGVFIGVLFAFSLSIGMWYLIMMAIPEMLHLLESIKYNTSISTNRNVASESTEQGLYNDYVAVQDSNESQVNNSTKENAENNGVVFRPTENQEKTIQRYENILSSSSSESIVEVLRKHIDESKINTARAKLYLIDSDDPKYRKKSFVRNAMEYCIDFEVNERMFIVHDSTNINSCERGFVLSDKAFYQKVGMNEPVKIKLECLKGIEVTSDSIRLNNTDINLENIKKKDLEDTIKLIEECILISITPRLLKD